MNKIKSFNNAKEFKEIFGINQFGCRKNKILLTLLKSKELWENREKFAYLFNEVCSLRSQHELFNVFMEAFTINRPQKDSNNKTFRCKFLYCFDDRYSTDYQNGICEDGDFQKIRVIITENGKTVVRKTSPGKVLNHIIKGSQWDWLPDAVVNFLCEKFTEHWTSYCAKEFGGIDLIVDKSFDKIYSSNLQKGDFRSCMNDEDFAIDFYEYVVDASAARLENKDGEIIARCVIFNEVIDCGTGEKYRLAERQYSSDGNFVFQQLLVSKLIDGGYIDGYKLVGSGCHESRAFVKNDGTSLVRNKLKIRVDETDYAPYMDSFKWLDINEGFAYNYETDYYTNELTRTDGVVEENLCEVICSGHTTYVSEQERDDCYTYIESMDAYVSDDDVVSCEHCGEYTTTYSDDYRYSEFMDADYCCEDCRNEGVITKFADLLKSGDFDEFSGRETVYFYGIQFSVNSEVYDALDSLGYLNSNDEIDESFFNNYVA